MNDAKELFKSIGLFNEGTSLAKSGKYKEAIKRFDEAIKLKPEYADAWYNKGVALIHLGRYDETIECFDKVIEINPQDAGAWTNKGVSLGKLGKYEEAITCYDKAIEINEKFALARNNKGVALALLCRYDEAIECFDKAIECFDKAIECFDKAIKIDLVFFASVWGNKGRALDNLGKYEEAITSFNKAIEIYPKYAEAWYNKGIVLLKTGNVEDASKAFDKAHGIDLNEYKYWTGWITSLYEEGKLDRSLCICEKGIEYFKGKDERLKINALKELFYQKGVILTKQGKSDEGLSAFKEASKRGNKQAQQVINQLRETKRDWWEWWFSDVMTVTYFWKFTNRHLFITLFILLHLAGIFYCFYLPSIKSIGGITLAFLGVASLIGLLLISGKALLGIALTEILIAMLIFPLTLLTLSSFNKIPSASIENISKIWIWQIWIASIIALVFVLFHRIIRRIKTPFVEVEMPELKAIPPEIKMAELEI